MPAVYLHHHRVASDEIDPLGHANNVSYVQWMQDAAVAHSSAQGWPGPRYQEIGSGWVVRGHEIEYLLPAFAGEDLVIETWVTTMKKATSVRRYIMRRSGDGAILATAQTRWAFVSYETGLPARIPPEVATAFEVVEQE